MVKISLRVQEIFAVMRLAAAAAFLFFLTNMGLDLDRRLRLDTLVLRNRIISGAGGGYLSGRPGLDMAFESGFIFMFMVDAAEEIN